MTTDRKYADPRVPSWLFDFACESNRIEGMGPANAAECAALRDFIYGRPTVERLQAYVGVVAPGHRLRDKRGLNVRVGDHIAPPGGPEIRDRLVDLLATLDQREPYHVHIDYETLHPFTDGNGRSGRALWLWHHISHGTEARPQAIGFLHTFYYEALSNSRR